MLVKDRVAMKRVKGLYAIVDAALIDTLNFDDFVQSKETVRFNRDRSKFLVQYNARNNFIPNVPILSHEYVAAKVRTSPLWKNAGTA